MTAEIYRVGERVDGLYDENTDDMWYPGRIRCVHLSENNDSADGPTFEVLYDDGEMEMHVRPEFLRQHVPGTICVGTRVLCRYDGGEEFYPGQVSDVQENGMYTIAYDDGEVEEDVPLVYIMEPKEDAGGENAEAAEKDDPSEADDVAIEEAQQQQDAEMEDVQGYPSNSSDMHQENEEDGKTEFDEPVAYQLLKNAEQPPTRELDYDEAPQHTLQNEGRLGSNPGGVSAERTYIIESLELLEKRLGDAASTKSVLSTLVKQMRAYPQITADLVHERGGERLIIDSLKFHQAHAVIQCYGFVLLRRLCFLCVKSTHYLLRNGIVELVIQAMNAFTEDAILQASACGALAVFTRVNVGLNSLIEYQVAQLVLSTLIYHKTYSVHTRQVHYYACEVLLELCELDDLQTLNLLCGEQEEEFAGDISPVSLLLFLLRQGLSLDDKKACCAVGSLLMCLAASGRRAAALVLSLNGLAELSTVMARYPTEPSIQKYSTAASKQIALCSVRESPTKRIKDTATEILRETESLENTPRDRQPTKRSAPRGRSRSIGKRKSNPTAGYGSPVYPRGAAYTSGTPYRNDQEVSKGSSPFGQRTFGFGGETNSFGYPGRDYPASSTAPQQPSTLVILDGSLGMNSGFGSTNKRKQISKEDRQSELFDAYGIQGIPNCANGRPYGTKRAQLKAHLASAESAWAAPQQHEIFHDPAYLHRDFIPSSPNRWEYGDDEPQYPGYDPDMRQDRGTKRKMKTPVTRTKFQVRLENDNQLRVSRETRSPYPSPQRLGAATKRAAKARQNRITGGAHSSLIGKPNNASSESLNEYATQLFQDNAARAGSGILTSAKLTPREKEEIRERERLSFAEKLHKMIDKAKSTLANSNTASVDDAVRPQKVAATSKIVRTTREPSADEKRPLSKKTRTAVNSTPKNVSKDFSSPREAKPTSGLPKRQTVSNDAGAQQPVVPRAKPIASRSVATSKGTTDSKPRIAAKSSRAAMSKLVDKHEGEKDKGIAEVAPAEVDSAGAIAIEEPHPVEPVAVASEADRLPTRSDQEVFAPSKTVAVEEIKPTNEVVQAEASAVSVDVDTSPESEAKANIAGPGNEHDTTAEAGTESSDPSVDAVQPSESLLENPSAAPKSGNDQPSGGSTVADVMYGDDYGDFDDNGGDDEDMTIEAGGDTDGAHTSATGTSEPATDAPLQGSKSGEALYDDGYNEFDEDEGTEAVNPPAAEAVDNHDTEASDAISSQTTEEVSNPAANASESEAEYLVDSLHVPTVEEIVSVPTEGAGDYKKSLEHDTNLDEQSTNLDEQSTNAGVEGPESNNLVSEPENSQAAVEADDNASHVNATQVEFDAPETRAEGEQDKDPATIVDSNTSVLEVNDRTKPEGDAHAEPVKSAVGDGTTILDNEPKVPGGEKEDDAYEYETTPEAGNDVAAPTIEPTEMEGVAEVSDPDTVLEDSPADVKETNTQPGETLEASDASPLLEQNNDDDSKKLTADSSDASIQSAAYDEENFDDEEIPQEVESIEAVKGPVVSPAQETVEVVEQRPEDATSEIAEAPVAATPSDGVEEKGSNGLVANSSELSVQSAAYDDDDFDDGAEKNADNIGVDHQEHDEQQPSAVGGTDNTVSDAPADEAPEGVEDENKTQGAIVDSEVPSAVSEGNGGGGFNDTIRDDAPSKVATAEATQESPELQFEHSDSTSNIESEPADTAPSVIVNSDTPVTVKREESEENIQEPVTEEAEKCDDPVHVDSADEVVLENDNSSAVHATDTEDPVKPSATTESSIDPSAEGDAPESEESEIVLPADGAPVHEQQEALENSAASVQPATSTLDSSPLEEERSDESSWNDVPDILSSSRQTSVDANDSAREGVGNTDNPAAPSEALPGPELLVTDQSEQLTDERTPSPAVGVDASDVVDTANDSVLEVAIEPESAVNPVDDAVHQAESPSTADDADEWSSINEETCPGSETALSEPELQSSTPDKQPADLEVSTPPDENASPSLGASIQVSERSSQSTDSAELDGAEVAVAAYEDEAESNAVGTAQNVVAAEMPGYTQCFDEEHPPGDDPDKSAVLSDPSPADISVPAETSAEPSTDSTGEEPLYGDAEFNVENDAAAEKGELTETEIALSESSIGEEVSPAANSSTGDLPPADIDQAEKNRAEVNDDTEATVASPPTDILEKEDTPGLPETVLDDYADVVVYKHTAGAAAMETRKAVDDTTANVDQDTNTEAGVQDAVSNPNANQYDEDFPSESPVIHEDAAVDATASPGEVFFFTADVPDVSAGDSTQAPGASDVKEEQYDDGFDDENTPSDPSDAENTVDATPASEVGVANNDAPEISEVSETPDDCAASENEQTGSEQVDPAAGMHEENEGKPEGIDVAVKNEDAAAEPETTALESIDSEVMDPEITAVETNAVEATESEPVETEAVDSETVVSSAVEPGFKDAVELETGEPTSAGLETTDSEEVSKPEAVVSEIEEPETREAGTADVPEPSLESPSSDPVPEDPVVSKARQEEPPAKPLEALTLTDRVTAGDEGLSSTEIALDATVDNAPMETNHPSPIRDGRDANEDTPETPGDVVTIGPPQSDESPDNPESPSVENPAADNPSETIETVSPAPAHVDSEIVLIPAAEELPEPSSVDAGSAGENVGPADGATIIDEMTKGETTEVKDESVRPGTATSESSEQVKPALEGQAPVQDDYDDVDPPVDKVVNQDVTKATKATTYIRREGSEVKEQVSVPETSVKLAIEVDPPREVEIAATPAAANEGPTTEDQYDDDDGYNDFDDQVNESPLPAADPIAQAPIPAATATEAPATDDEYEDEDYGEDEKPVEAPIPEPVVQSTSAREEEIEEVADEPEQAEEEAYADDQDEYNNEDEEDDTTAPSPASKSTPPTKDPPAEASTDEYEDDHEEEYAEDEMEEPSPRPTVKAAPQPASTSDVEMDDEVDYDSDYAESDG